MRIAASIARQQAQRAYRRHSRRGDTMRVGGRIRLTVPTMRDEKGMAVANDFRFSTRAPRLKREELPHSHQQGHSTCAFHVQRCCRR